MNEIIKIEQKNGIETVNARELHEFLESKQDFSNWIKSRIEKYGFIENVDYTKVNKIIELSATGQKGIEYHISIDMAKQLSMVENNKKGLAAREYFIKCEKQLKTVKENLPEMIKAEIKKQLKIEAPKEKPIITKNYNLHGYIVSLVDYKKITYQITQNFYNKHKLDLRFYDNKKEYGSEIKIGFLSLDQLFRYMMRNL